MIHTSKTEKLFSVVLEYLHEGVLILNGQNIIALSNEAAKKILGVSLSEELQGKHISEIEPKDDSLQNLFCFLTEGEKANSNPNIGQGYTHRGLYSIRIFDIDSDIFKVIVLHDIRSTNKGAETLAAHTRSLEESNKELDHFAHIVSHDLKAPLRAINNLSLWLEEDLGPSLSGENRDNMKRLRGRVVRMEALINGILEYAKIGKEQIASEAVDVFKLLTEIIELLAPPAHIQIQIDPAMPVLNAPKVLLLQVLSNLISNAIKYNDKAEGLIKVTAQERETDLEFTIEDNGPGIAPEFHEKIFLIFKTLQARDKFESTGIGLTIVKRIITERGGAIRVESAVGKGSKFIFTWPR